MSKIIATSLTSNPEQDSQIEPSLWQQFFATFKPDSIIHRVRLIPGRYTNLRRLISFPLLILFFLTPWLKWQGLALVHLDLASKQFRFGNVIFWPEDLMVLTWMMVAGAFGLFFIAMAVGRLWCGFSCPQTVWTFLFLRIEEFFEGSRHKRLKMDRSPWKKNRQSIARGIRKALKHSAWLSLSLMTAISFIAYFYPINQMVEDFLAADFATMAIFWILLIGILTYLNAGFLREQVCTHMCPYSRFQSVMADASTITVHYDNERNDCIDCNVCVQVCPTDIDIRDGLQLDCIACGACVDGCNDIMDRINKPQGLISFRPEKTSLSEALNLARRPRLLGYALACILACGLIINEWNQREIINAGLERDRIRLYQVNSNDQVENHYALKLHNKAQDKMQFKLSIQSEGLENKNYLISQTQFTLASGQRLQLPITITQLQAVAKTKNKTPLEIDLISIPEQQVVATIHTSFMAPRQ